MLKNIVENFDQPEQLERLYRSDEAAFQKAFAELPAHLQETPAASFWRARLNYSDKTESTSGNKAWGRVMLLALVAGLLAKMPEVLNIAEERYYPRNIGFIIFPVLMAYFGWKKEMPVKTLLGVIGVIIISAIFINLLPGGHNNDLLNLSSIHLPLFLWALTGYVFVSPNYGHRSARLDYLRYNGDLVVMTALILIAGGIMTGLTISMFEIIGFKITTFYFEYVVTIGLAAAPVVGTYLTQSNPNLVGKVSPVIANLFSPLVLITLLIYLPAMLVAGKNPFTDREFLILFNAILIAVLALVFFSVTETTRSRSSRFQLWILSLLALVTIAVNSIALSAILFRIGEWGFTPNRIAVLGGNGLMLMNLLLIARSLIRCINNHIPAKDIGLSMGSFLPVYAGWTIFITFFLRLFF